MATSTFIQLLSSVCVYVCEAHFYVIVSGPVCVCARAMGGGGGGGRETNAAV